MPTVSVGRDRLFEALGRTYTEAEFDELCFDFGIELDDVTTEKAIIRKEKHLEEEEEVEGDEEVIYKIDVPANRYDLLCLEGLARALKIFLGLEPVPVFRLADMGGKSPLTMTVMPETALIRPFVVCAVLRGVTFDKARYNSFIDLQDRLHQNLCRRRTLVAIGTHDLDTLEAPFTYEALPPSDIRFVPLKQTKEFSAAELMEFYQADVKLKKFLPIISDSPVFPVFYDAKRTVLSLPPVINGAHSAISLDTKNVFIECSAVDLTKAKIVLNTLVAMFSEYCQNKFEVEPVEVVSANGTKALYPNLDAYPMDTDAGYINGRAGTKLAPQEMVGLLNRMQLPAQLVGPPEEGKIRVLVPPTRSDVLHACDITEDVAIAFGYNNIVQSVPGASTLGRQQPLNHFCDLLRAEVAQAGFTEVLTWALISHAENFEMMNRADTGSSAAIIGNPRSADFEVVRTSLLPGLLKTMGHNKDTARPIKLFEISDVVVLDPARDVGASNSRHLAALYCNLTSGFEVIHGLVGRIMEVVEAPLGAQGSSRGYHIKPSQAPEFFTGRQADIMYNGARIGTFGIVHPQVLGRFDIPDPCTAVELELEHFL